MTDWAEVSLTNIKGGRAVELFDSALVDVIENIFDPNVSVKQIREIKLIVKFKPRENDPQEIEYAIACDTKLAQPVPEGAFIRAGRRDGRFTAFEQDITQDPLPFSEPEDKLKIIPQGG